MRPLEISPDQAAVAERGVQAFVPQQPTHFIQSCPAAQPARRREVSERVRVQPSMHGQTSLRTQAVQDLHQVARLQRPALTVGEQERFG